MDKFKPTFTTAPSVRVDNLLFRVRWILLFLVLPVTWIDLGGVSFPIRLLIWFVVGISVNLLIGLFLQFSVLARLLPIPTLVVDTLLFGILPYIAVSGANLLAYFSIFPAIIAAIRLRPQIGLVVATLLSISLGIHSFLPLETSSPREMISTALPIVALFAAAILIGYLAQHEKEAAVKQATGELDELRGAMAGAKMLYQTSDWLNLSANYKPVLESMLEAGVKGLPEARREDGPPVAAALFFDDQDARKRLRVIAARGLDHHDEQVRIAGRAGIIARAFETGEAVVFDNVNKDPELSMYRALQMCRSGVCYPLRAGLELYGAVVLATPSPRRPSQQHLELMQAFTSQAGIAFQNAKLYQVSRQEQDRIIRNDIDMRQKLARDLHDGPTQKISGLAMQLDYVSKLIDQDPTEAKMELEKARIIAQQTVQEIRTALFTLRPLSLESEGLSAALEQFGERLREADNVPIQIVPGDFGTELDQNIAATVFAIIEEAVGNARKHGKNAPIYASVQRQENSLIAVVQDQGPGFSVEYVESSYDKRTSLGLQNMRDRAKLIDGNLTIDSAPGQGTRVTLVAPLPLSQSTGTKK